MVLIPVAVVLGGCMRPHYQRPAVSIPPGYRGNAAGPPGDSASLGEMRWQDLIRDERLNELIREALANNYDVRIAAARVLEARSQVMVARSTRFPSVDAQAGYTNLRTAREGSTPLPEGYPAESGFTNLLAALSWELDLWGRLRNANAAARAQLLATQEARRMVMETLAGQVAQTYFLLRDLDLEREIATRSIASRNESLELVRLRVENGYSSEMDLRQAEALVKTATVSLTDLERQSEQAENQMSTLLGRPPGPVPRGRSLVEQDIEPRLPPGLPSTLLERRPDIRQAEQELIGANAQVAVAKAAFFPRISLTASTGFESAALSGMLRASNGTWVLGPVGNLPIFNAGRTRAGVRGAQAREEQAALNYRRTVNQAFREVADGLVACRKLSELREQQQGLVQSLRSAVELADLRYRGGVSSYLEYLDSERQLLDAELRLVQVRRDQWTSVIDLYRALGGGWQ
jgi:multidrug efflux system outer membrane protein